MWASDWHMMDWGAGGSRRILSMIFWLLVFIAVIAGVIWLARPSSYFAKGRLGLPRRASSLDVLEERYARGEINLGEYLEKKRDLADRNRT